MADEDQEMLEDHSPSSVHSEDDQDVSGVNKAVSRQKRRKARRACLACQRAHLTCGDERPCQRCVKRGLQNTCHDGVRKKAKYLHDAPNEALELGAANTYVAHTKHSIASTASGNDSSLQAKNNMAPPASIISLGSNALSPSTETRPALVRDSSLQSQAVESDQRIQRHGSGVSGLDQTFFEPGDPSLFNFDLASMNFGNHYGALEFGMLGHLSSGANHDNMHRHSSTTYDNVNLNSSLNLPTLGDPATYGMNLVNPLTDWQANPGGQGLQMNTWSQGVDQGASFRRQSGEPYAYAIEAVSNDALGVSPESIGLIEKPTPPDRKYDSPLLPTPARPTSEKAYSYQSVQAAPSNTQMRQIAPSEAIAKKLGSLPAAVRKRRRDPSSIYSSVTRPYPYTSGFHALTAYLQRRFSSQKRLAIAQALASIRPSFISCTRTLIDDDLVFMEKCFQRQLVEYEDFIGACGTPTIVCRRTGEVAYAGKEFSLLTGWTKDILLGKAPNLNVNGYSPSGTMTAASGSRTGVNTPRGNGDAGNVNEPLQPTRPQAVFLAELLDDDSVVQFYEDFAKLAFADSKGSAWRACKLLKYKTKDDKLGPIGSSTLGTPDDGNLQNDIFSGGKRDRAADNISRITTGSQRHRSKNAVDCMYCWTVRRDVFDIPMMIVINFLPTISPLLG